MVVGMVMADHPSWAQSKDGSLFRVVRSGGSVWSIVADGIESRASLISGTGPQPVVDVIDPARSAGHDSLGAELRGLGPVARWRNPDLWDALATSIIRQVIRADHARRLYRVFCFECGELVSSAFGSGYLFPTPQLVLGMSSVDFARLGLAFKMPALRAAAEAVSGDRWSEVDSGLIDELQQIHRVGAWTAGATVADLSNDFASYPYADLAVRTWARRLEPTREWPDDEAEFGRVWARLAADYLSDRTLLTLAWGDRYVRNGEMCAR